MHECKFGNLFGRERRLEDGREACLGPRAIGKRQGLAQPRFRVDGLGGVIATVEDSASVHLGNRRCLHHGLFPRARKCPRKVDGRRDGGEIGVGRLCCDVAGSRTQSRDSVGVGKRGRG